MRGMLCSKKLPSLLWLSSSPALRASALTFTRTCAFSSGRLRHHPRLCEPLRSHLLAPVLSLLVCIIYVPLCFLLPIHLLPSLLLKATSTTVHVVFPALVTAIPGLVFHTVFHFCDVRCPCISLLPGVLRALVYTFEGPATDEGALGHGARLRRHLTIYTFTLVPCYLS
jgi:hypothetical protein